MHLTLKYRKLINRDLSVVLKKTYFPSIPLDEIFKCLKEHGVIVVTEDGFPWSGFLCGESSYANFDLQIDGNHVDNCYLCLSWHKMSSGNMEVIGYVS